MAKYRQIHVKIWKDTWFSELSSPHKLFFVYLFSNEMASISGIYELPKRIMSFESGLSYGEIDAAFEEFSRAGKAFYEDGIVLMPGIRKYHETKSPKVQSCIMSDLSGIKDCKLKERYCGLYGIDRVSDTLSILSSSSSYSSSSGFSSNGNGKNHFAADPVQEFITELSLISSIPHWAPTEKEYEDAAFYIIGKDATLEQVKGFADWWKVNTYYEDKTAKAALKTIIKEWDSYVSGHNPNGKQPETVTFWAFDEGEL